MRFRSRNEPDPRYPMSFGDAIAALFRPRQKPARPFQQTRPAPGVPQQRPTEWNTARPAIPAESQPASTPEGGNLPH